MALFLDVFHYVTALALVAKFFDVHQVIEQQVDGRLWISSWRRSSKSGWLDRRSNATRQRCRSRASGGVYIAFRAADIDGAPAQVDLPDSY